MTWVSWVALSPYGIIGITVLLVLVSITVRRRHTAVAGLTVGGLLLAWILLFGSARAGPLGVTRLFRFDHHAAWFGRIIVACALGTALLAYGYLERRGAKRPEELYALLLLATLGSVLLGASDDLSAAFLALETLTVPLYGMIGYLRHDRRGVEAALKYFVPAATASAVFLFGAGLVYGQIGTLELASLGLATGPVGRAGLLLVLFGFAFKLALVPFHMWTPDVYQGAPAPVSAFIATVSKGGAVAFSIRLLAAVGPEVALDLTTALAILAALSILAGNLLALMQRSVKRILAYSSIAHLGYLVVAVVSGGFGAAGFYFAAYAATTLLAFGVVTVISGPTEDADDLDAYRGLMWRRPAIALAMAGALLSLAGVPITAGFFGKLYVVTVGAAAAEWALLLVLVLGSVIGLVYYLRVLVATFTEAGPGVPRLWRVPRPAATVLLVAALVVLGLGLFPEAVQTW